MFKALIDLDLGVSSQRETTPLRREYLAFFYILGIDGCGCFRKRVSYGPKGGIPCNLFSMFEALIDMGMSEQRADTALRGESLSFFSMFEEMMDVGVTAKGSATSLRGRSLAIFLCLRH